MKVFLSAVEHGAQEEALRQIYIKENGKVKIDKNIMSGKSILYYNLISFYYINNKNFEYTKWIRDTSKEIMIDSGAHSFQKGKKVDWDKYAEQYAEFIKKFDKHNVIGYFEMDVDNIIGYDKVLELRKKLEKISNKIIPVWHKNRGIEEYKKMCKDYAGKIIAITGFKNEDIKDEQYLMFLKYAKKYNCKVHCLGMTRKKILNTVPFDFVDSSSWAQDAIYGRISNKGKVTKNFSKTERKKVFLLNYLQGMKMQEYYYNKWKKVCND